MSETIGELNINYEAPKDNSSGGLGAENLQGAKLTPEQINELMENQGLLRTNMLDKIEEKLKDFDRNKDNTKELEILSEIEGSREKLLNSVLDTQLELAELNLNHENSYPYQSGHGRSYLKSVSNSIEEWNQINFKKEETKALVKMMTFDSKWALALYENQEGIAHRVKYYYAGADKIKNSMLEQKKCINMENLHMQYSGSGDVVLSNAEKDKLTFKITDTKSHTEQTYKTESLREKAIDYQDSFRFWSKAVAALAKWDYEKDAKSQKLMPNHPCMRDDLAPKMIRELFQATDEKVSWSKNKGKIEFNHEPSVASQFPEKILHFFSMDDTPENRRRYYSLMMALMENDAYTKIKDIAKKDINDDTTKSDIDSLITNVKDKSNEYLMNFSDARSIDFKLKELVIKSGITHYQGTGSVAPLSPSWEYEKRLDSNGKMLGYQRVISMGPLSTQGDDWSPYYHFYHDMYYDLIARKRSSFEVPTISNFRERYVQFHPEDKPDISLEEAKKVDPNIKYVFDMCLSNTDEAKQWRIDNKMEIDETTRKVALSLVHFIMTPYVAKNNVNATDASYLTTYKDPLPGKKSNDEIYKFILRPTFIPPTFRSVNLYEVMYPTDSEDTNSIPRTAWQMECDGVDPSNINYLSVPLEIDDYNQTSQNMASRLLNLKTEVFDKERESNYQSFFANVGGVKEIIKRIGLGWRGEKWFYYDTDDKKWKDVPKETREIILAAEFIALGVNMNEGIVSRGYRSERRENTLRTISEWINMDEYMPPEKKLIKNYNSGLSNLTFLHLNLFDRMGLDHAEQESRDASSIKVNVVDKYFGKFNK